MKKEKIKRNKEIIELRKRRMASGEIAEKYSITPERVRAICNKAKEKEIKESSDPLTAFSPNTILKLQKFFRTKNISFDIIKKFLQNNPEWEMELLKSKTNFGRKALEEIREFAKKIK